jgi:hypothetical protein
VYIYVFNSCVWAWILRLFLFFGIKNVMVFMTRIRSTVWIYVSISSSRVGWIQNFIMQNLLSIIVLMKNNVKIRKAGYYSYRFKILFLVQHRKLCMGVYSSHSSYCFLICVLIPLAAYHSKGDGHNHQKEKEEEDKE